MSLDPDPNKHRRRSVRLQGYDYSQPGSYFVTICTQGKACLFGEIVDGEMVLNVAGRALERWWDELNRKFPSLETDAFVVMPNHVHGIIMILGNGGAPVAGEGAHVGAPLPIVNSNNDNPVGADLCVRPEPRACPDTSIIPPIRSASSGISPVRPSSAPLSAIVRWFKTMTTNEYIRGVKQSGWPPFMGRLWQGNYYEHIIRNEASLNRIRQYVDENPTLWSSDRENPAPSTNSTAVVRPPGSADDIETISGGHRP